MLATLHLTKAWAKGAGGREVRKERESLPGRAAKARKEMRPPRRKSGMLPPKRVSWKHPPQVTAMPKAKAMERERLEKAKRAKERMERMPKRARERREKDPAKGFQTQRKWKGSWTKQ